MAQKILWKWMTHEELDEIRKSKISKSEVKRDKNGTEMEVFRPMNTKNCNRPSVPTQIRPAR